MRVWGKALFVVALGMFACFGQPAQAARDAAFLEPGTSGGKTASSDAVTVEPKSDVDVGEIAPNVAKRVSLFFANQTTAVIKVLSLTVTSDGNVKADIVDDDCTKQGKIDGASRCSVGVEILSTQAGAWAVEVQMTHEGAGRIARARLSGKTFGQKGDVKENGLSLNTKEVKPVDFGDVEAGDGKAVRSALMTNDSAVPLTLLSIDVIAADNGLEKLDQGCAVDEELKPGESCPVTLVWKPEHAGQISTDLIIRHTGQSGFSVIPLRGQAKGETAGQAASGAGSAKSEKGSGGKSAAPPPLEDVQNELRGVPALRAEDLKLPLKEQPAANGGETLKLLGTVGNKAIIKALDGSSVIVSLGDEIDVGEKKLAKINQILPNSMEILVGGKKKLFTLQKSSGRSGIKSSSNLQGVVTGGSAGGTAGNENMEKPNAVSGGGTLSGGGTVSGGGTASGFFGGAAAPNVSGARQ